MKIILYPYKLIQRTEYSKFQVFNENNENISDTTIGKKILEDYNKQITNPNRYFEVKGTVLKSVLETINDDNIEHLFIPCGITDVADEAANKLNIKHINIPNTVKTIGEYAFYWCTKLEAIDVPESVINFGKDCFRACVKMKHINLPNNLTELSELMFVNCSVLEEINMPNQLEIIKHECFNSCKALKRIIIPDSVRTIEDLAFGGCEGLEYIELPKSIEVLSDGIFCGCEKLSKIEIPDTVTKIGTEAFSQTESLDIVSIPKNLNTIGWRIFFESGVKTLVFNHDLKNVEGLNPYKKRNSLLNSSCIDKLVIDKNVKVITPYAVGEDGVQITKIDYLGTKTEFEKFKKQNSELFSLLPNLKEVSFSVQEKKPINRESLER